MEGDDTGIESWLTTLARNAAIDFVRRRHRWEPLHAAFEPQSIEVSDVEAVALSRVQLDVLWLAVHRLSDDQRLPIIASFYMELSHQSIADAMQFPLGTVKTRIRAGLKRLRKALATEDGGNR